MTQSRISHNVIKVPDVAKFFEHVTPLNPRAMVVLNDASLAHVVKDKLPDCTVIYRFKGGQPGENDDGEGILRYTADEWLDMMSHKLNGDKRIVLYAGNEMPLNAAVVEWLRKLVLRANERGWKLCVLNLATGNPGGQNIVESWAVAKPLLTLLSLYRQHILGLHAYFGAVVSSGMYGGHPDNAGVHPGQPGGKNLIPRTAWPTDVSGVTCYHLGRHKFLMQYCDSVNLPYPRIIITEYGADDTYDIKPWLATLKKTAGYLEIRGWRSLVEQWKIWYSGIDAEEVYADMLIYGDDTIYVGSPVEAECIFQMGNDTDWQGFNVWGATRLLARLIAHARATPPPPEPPMKIIIEPDDARFTTLEFTLKSTGAVSFLRDQPGIGANIIVRFVAEKARYIPLERLAESEKRFDKVELDLDQKAYWLPVLWQGRVAWVRQDAVEILSIQPDPPELPEPPPDLSIIFRQHREAWQMLIDSARRDLAPLLDEQHALNNKIQKLKTQIGMFEQWRADFDTIEDVIEAAANKAA